MPSSTRFSSRHGHSTTTIPRPKDVTESRTAGADRPEPDESRFADFTRPIPEERQLVRGRGKRGIIILGAFVVIAALIAALFVLPVQAWLRQQDDISSKERELAALDDINAQITEENAQLQTPEGIEEAAREVIGYVQRGEIRLTVLPSPEAPPTMPSGWPYDAIAQIVTTRAAPPVSTP